MAFNNYMPMQQYGQYNALAPYQQRLDMMQQQYGAMQPQQPVQQQMQSNMGQVKGWPVTGEEEARRAMIEPMDPSVYFFPDLANGKVYTKQINPETFAPMFRVFQLVDNQPAPVQPAPIDTSMFAQRDEVEQLRATVASMQETIDQLRSYQHSAPPTPATKEGKK